MKVQGKSLYPFIPSGPSFATAIKFFAELGFQKEWEQEGYAGLRFGGAYFILQDADIPEMQINLMIVFEVDDLDEYWNELRSKNLSDAFSGVTIKPPTNFPWGRELHIIDPAGVCHHVRGSSEE